MNLIFCKTLQLDELEAIRIEHPLFKATLLLQGAQLIEFCPSNNNFINALWLSPSAKYKTGTSIRGGIPICWPWFGNLDKNPSEIQQQVPQNKTANAHGFARNLNWQVKSIEEDCHQVVIELILASNKNTKQTWPYDFELCARFIFSNSLELELKTKNNGEIPFSISQALHSYFPTADIQQTYIHNAHASRYVDALDHWQQKLQSGRIAFSQETDRLYFFDQHRNKHQYVLRVETPDQQLEIHTENSQSAVIWNPWIEKSKRLSQFKDEDYQHMFCIESANVLSDIQTIKAGQSASLKLTLSTSPS